MSSGHVLELSVWTLVVGLIMLAGCECAPDPVEAKARQDLFLRCLELATRPSVMAISGEDRAEVVDRCSVVAQHLSRGSGGAK